MWATDLHGVADIRGGGGAAHTTILGIDEPTGFAADGSSIPPKRLHFTEVFNSYSSGLDGSLAMRYNEWKILSFKDADTRKLAHGDRVRRFVNLESVARRKLRQIEIANVL